MAVHGRGGQSRRSGRSHPFQRQTYEGSERGCVGSVSHSSGRLQGHAVQDGCGAEHVPLVAEQGHLRSQTAVKPGVRED